MSSSAISGLNFSNFGGIKVDSYNLKNNKLGTTTQYKTQTYEEDNNSEVYISEVPDHIKKRQEMSLWEKFLDDFKIADFENTTKSAMSNSFFYTATALIDKKTIDLLINSGGIGSKTYSSSVVLGLVSFTAGFSKVISGEITGKEFGISFIQGFSKPLIKDVVEKRLDIVVQSSLGKLLPSVDTGAFSELIKKSAKVGRVYKDPTKYKSSFLSGGSKWANQIFKNQMFNSLSSMGISCGVDYVASVGVNIITGLLDDGKVDWDEAKLGSTFLKSSCKTVCATAFETMGTFAGPTGRKIGKTIGTIVGATIGEFLVDVFDGDETWCAIAGGALIGGAAIGGIVATYCVTAGVIAASIPVAGWIVGGAMIVGAAVGVAGVWLWKVFTGG